MRYRRADIVDRAIDALDAHGLAALSMRTLAAELDVRASALYHHFDNKAALLAAVADEILRRGRRATEIVAWEAELRLTCVELRDGMRAHRDGAALVTAVYDAGGVREPQERMADALRRGGAGDDLARVGARTLLRFVLSHVHDDSADFALGLGIVLAGLGTRVP
ncbi:TetR/AcrR family tetracycline transcriptional repressor [Nocardioides thalensis]|uniref:TetR/AcrR family tetracycline transcriptional repressor n=1 Tax=Nocardioides thalensis TaxID=1914755 RepID=A0A853C295_9ACTN|nr:TetR family transcriptional regulator [Nocardioides thalensis]NYJ00708.1 TetR/AcrR family tetracycline transcriptional repressor [Nocardioides thalensis]